MKKFDTSGSSRRLRRAVAAAWWALSAATLVACGGGGGGGGAPAPAPVAPTPTPINQGPTPARLVEVSSSAVGALSVSWLPATDDTTAPAALRYQVHASTDAAFVPSATTLRAATTGSTSATISAGLVPGTRYTVKVVALDSQDATSAASAALDAVVSDTVATPAPGVTTQSLAAAQVATVTANSVVLAAGAAVPAPGTVIASSEANGGAGFLRRVTGTSTAAGVTTVNTSPVGLAQVMQQVRVSSTYRLDTVPAEVAQAAAALDRRSMQRLADGSQRQSFNWPETGLSYGTDAGANVQRRTVLAARQPSALGGVATAGFKSSGGATVNEEYGQMAGQTRVEVNEGQSGQDTWTVDITSNDKPLLPLFLSSKVGICKVEVGPVRYSGDDGKPALVKVTATNFQAVETRDGNRITRATQAIKFEALAGASAEKPYRVKITASLDDVDDNCQGSAREQVHIEVLITVTKDSFPTQEAAEETYSGSAGYSIVNRVVTSFSPKLVFDQDISLGRLQSARISVSASPMVEQTLTLTATAQGTVDATKIIVKPRTFRKVYVTPAGIPIVISGEFRIDLRIQGNVSGALNATEVLNIGYEEVSFGVEYRNGEFVPVKSATPVYSLKIAGDGKAEADLTLTLLPRLELRAWEALTGVAVLAPALKAEAGVEGLVRLDAVVDFENDAQLVTATDADYRLTKASLFAGLKSYVYADLSIWDERLLVYPNESAKKGDYNTFEPFEMLAWTELMGLPTLSAFMPEGEGAIHPTDTRLLKVRGQAADVTNPLFTLFPTVLPESFMPWTRWTAAKIVQQLAVPPASYARVADPGGDSAVAWLRFMQPGTYTVRLGGHSKLGSWARQYVELEVAVFDDNANGIMDWWERRYALQGDGGAAIAQADPDGDGATNLQEWLAGTDPNTPQPPPGRLMADPATASVLQSIRFWVLDAVQAVASVVWNFGAGLAEQVAAVSNGVSAAVSQAYDSTGVKTVVATFKDAVGAVLGIRSTQVTVVTPGPVVTDVSPLLATAGTPRSFTVTGRELPDGLRFQLLGCANPVEAPGGNSARREFSCTFPVNTPAGNYDGTVALSDNPFGAPPPYTFTVTVGVPVVGAVQPAGATRTLSTSFEIAGQGLPTSGITVVPVGDSRSTCQAPNNLAASGFGVACELFKVGAQVLEVRQGTDVLGRVTVNVASNVTGVTWASPSTTSSGTVLFGETVTYKVAGTNLLADTTMGFAVERCGVSNTEIGVPSNTERTFTCFFNNEAGAVAGQMPGVVKDAPGGQVLLEGWVVPVEVSAVIAPIEIRLQEADQTDWRTQFTIKSTGVASQVGRYEFSGLSCGGTLTYRGRTAAAGFLFRERLTYGNCVDACDLEVDAGLTAVRELCTPVVRAGEDRWRALSPHAYTPTQLEALLQTLLSPSGVVQTVADTLEAAISAAPAPRAPWTFGWQSISGAAPTPYGKFSPAGTLTGYPTLATWNKADGTAAANVYPYVYKNTSATTSVNYGAGIIAFPPQSIIVTPGTAGERAVFRWTAPSAGPYEVSARFESMQGGLVDVRVQKNGANLFAQQISGAGSVATAPAQTLNLSAGDAIDFAVGDGGNTNHSDITRVSATVRATTTQRLRSPANGIEYEVINCGTWLQCRDAARARGGQLVTIRSQADNAWIVSNLLPSAQNEYGLWIGLTDEAQEGVWRWSSGEAVVYTNWRLPGEPSNRWLDGRAEAYVHMWRGNATITPGVWNDIVNEPIPVGVPTSLITQAVVEYAAVGVTTPLIAVTDVTLPSRMAVASDTLAVCGTDFANSGSAKVLVQFDLAQIPTSASQVSLNLFLHQGDNQYDALIEVFRNTGPWAAETASYQGAPATANPAVDAVASNAGNYGRWVVFPVTGLVKGWQSGTFANHGITLNSASVSSSGCRYFSSSRASANRPYVSWQ